MRINLSRIRTMIQHPVNNPHPSSKILILERPEQKTSPILFRILLNCFYEIVQSSIRNSAGKLHDFLLTN